MDEYVNFHGALHLDLSNFKLKVKITLCPVYCTSIQCDYTGGVLQQDPMSWLISGVEVETTTKKLTRNAVRELL